MDVLKLKCLNRLKGWKCESLHLLALSAFFKLLQFQTFEFFFLNIQTLELWGCFLFNHSGFSRQQVWSSVRNHYSIPLQFWMYWFSECHLGFALSFLGLGVWNSNTYASLETVVEYERAFGRLRTQSLGRSQFIVTDLRSGVACSDLGACALRRLIFTNLTQELVNE